MALGNGIAKGRKVHEGDVVAFNSYNGTPMLFQVQDIFSAESALVSADMVLISEADFRRLFGVTNGKVTGLTLKDV